MWPLLLSLRWLLNFFLGLVGRGKKNFYSGTNRHAYSYVCTRRAHISTSQFCMQRVHQLFQQGVGQICGLRVQARRNEHRRLLGHGANARSPSPSRFVLLRVAFSAAHVTFAPPALRAFMSLDAFNSFSRSQVFVVVSAVLEGIKINLSKAVFQVTHSPHCLCFYWLTDMPRASKTAALQLSIRSRVCARSPSLAITFYPCSSSRPAASSSSIYRRFQMSILFTCAPSCPCLQARILTPCCFVVIDSSLTPLLQTKLSAYLSPSSCSSSLHSV